MQKQRLDRYNSLLKKVVGDYLQEQTYEIQSDFGMITLHSVELSSDLSYLDVFVSCLKNQEMLCKTLKEYATDLKKEINTNIMLRKMPIIRFRYNDEIEYTTHLINEINSLETDLWKS